MTNKMFQFVSVLRKTKFTAWWVFPWQLQTCSVHTSLQKSKLSWWHNLCLKQTLKNWLQSSMLQCLLKCVKNTQQNTSTKWSWLSGLTEYSLLTTSLNKSSVRSVTSSMNSWMLKSSKWSKHSKFTEWCCLLTFVWQTFLTKTKK